MTTMKKTSRKHSRTAAAIGVKVKSAGCSKVVRMHSAASGRDIAVSRESDRIIRETSLKRRKALEILADS